MASARHTTSTAKAAALLILGALPGCASAPAEAPKPVAPVVRTGVATDTAVRAALSDTLALREIVSIAKGAGLQMRTLSGLPIQVDEEAKAGFMALNDSLPRGSFIRGTASSAAANSAQSDRNGAPAVTNVALHLGRNTDGSLILMAYNPLRLDNGLPAMHFTLRVETNGGLQPSPDALHQVDERINAAWASARVALAGDIQAIEAEK